MFELFLADGCMPFSIALSMMLCIGVIELFTSGTASAVLDGLLTTRKKSSVLKTTGPHGCTDWYSFEDRKLLAKMFENYEKEESCRKNID